MEYFSLVLAFLFFPIKVGQNPHLPCMQTWIFLLHIPCLDVTLRPLKPLQRQSEMFRNTSSEYFNCSSRPNPLNIALRHFGSALESLKQNWSIWMQCQNSPGSSSAAPKWIISTRNTNTALVIAARLQFIFLWNTIQEKLKDDTFFFISSVVWTKIQAVFWCFVKCLAAFSILVCPTNPLIFLSFGQINECFLQFMLY